MSLINQMLKDLEQRDSASVSVSPTSGEVRAVPVASRYRPLSLVFLLVGVLISGLATWLYMSRDQPMSQVVVSAPGPVGTATKVTPTIINSVPIFSQEVEAKLDASESVLGKSIDTPPSSADVSPVSPDIEHLSVSPQAVDTLVKSLRVNVSDENIRMIFDVSSIPEYRFFQLYSPDRLVIDLSNTTLTKDLFLPKQKPEVLLGLRTASRNKKDLRIVLDLNDSVTPKILTFKADNNSGPRLVVVISPAVPVETRASASDAPSTLSKSLPTAPAVLGKTTSATQKSDNLYRQSVTLLQQGREQEAQQVLRKSLDINSYNLKARQALVGLLVGSKHAEEASQWLKDGLKLSPAQSSFSMTLARLQLESGDSESARDTLAAGLLYAGTEANYHAFYAALLQRDNQHKAAIEHYLTALRTNPVMPTWLVGIGISLQAQGQFNDAIAAYQRARDTGQLTSQLAQFVASRLKQIGSR